MKMWAFVAGLSIALKRLPNFLESLDGNFVGCFDLRSKSVDAKFFDEHGKFNKSMRLVDVVGLEKAIAESVEKRFDLITFSFVGLGIVAEALESDLKGAKVAGVAVVKVRSAYESGAKEKSKLEFNILLAFGGGVVWLRVC